MTLVDLHAHLLPGVDDGSPDIQTSLELARKSVADGVTHMLLTPHHMDGQYTNHKRDVIQKTEIFQNELNKAGILLNVFPGQEVHLTDKLIDAIDNDDILFADSSNRYLMLELPHTHVPEYFLQNVLPELRVRGIIPIIVHPERNQGIQRNHQILYNLVNAGCLTQITASSYLGIFGDKVTDLTQKIIDANLGTTFSSDAHALKGRGSKMNKAYEKLNNSNEEQAIMFWEDAKAILNGENCHIKEIKQIDEKKGFWQKILGK